MKFCIFAVAVLGLVASAAGADEQVVDADGNGSFSLAEVQQAYPALTAEDFQSADFDGSGALSAEELAIVIAASG